MSVVLKQLVDEGTKSTAMQGLGPVGRGVLS